MDKVRFSIISLRRGVALAILALILLPTTTLVQTARSQETETAKQKTMRQIAENWIQVGTKQYQRGFYRQAEKSFSYAQDYEEYLAPVDRDKLTKRLIRTRKAVLERARIAEYIQAADILVKQGGLVSAKTHLEKIHGSEFLTEQERKLIKEGLKKIIEQLDEQKRQITELYNRSVELYQAGQLKKAREGFATVAESGLVVGQAGMTAEDYMVKIDGIFARKVEFTRSIEAKPEQKVPDSRIVVVDEMAEDKTEAAKTPDKPKLNLLQSYTGAVLSDAEAKAQNYVSQGQYDRAKGVIESAKDTVNKNQTALGDNLFTRYSSRLDQLAERIAETEAKNETTLQFEQPERTEPDAIGTQTQYEQQVHAERSKRIAELIKSAGTSLEKERYEEALDQLEILLAIVRELVYDGPVKTE